MWSDIIDCLVGLKTPPTLAGYQLPIFSGHFSQSAFEGEGFMFVCEFRVESQHNIVLVREAFNKLAGTAQLSRPMSYSHQSLSPPLSPSLSLSLYLSLILTPFSVFPPLLIIILSLSPSLSSLFFSLSILFFLSSACEE